MNAYCRNESHAFDSRDDFQQFSSTTRKTSIQQELVKYRLPNIYYNRELEIEFFSCLIKEEKIMGQRSGKEYKSWIKEAKLAFHKFVRDLELKRRQENGTVAFSSDGWCF